MSSQPTTSTSSATSTNSYYSNVFIVGSTGTVGQHITRAFLKNHPNVKVQILVRKESETKSQELTQLGAHIVYGDITTSTPQDLINILQGVEVVVSAVSGDDKILYDGQVKLLQAAKKAHVKKFVPSSFGVNYSKLDYGDVLANDPKKKLFDQALVKAANEGALDYLLIHTGLFYPIVASIPNFLYEYNKETHTVRYDGELNAPVSLSDLDDIGTFTAEASLRKDIKNRDVIVKPDVRTIEEIAKLLHGNQVKFEKRLSESELKQEIVQRLKKGIQPQDFFPLLILQLRWVYISRKTLNEFGKFESNDIDKLFPTIKTKSYVEFLSNQPKPQQQ